MLEKLTLQNFEAHKNSTLEFVPGVNVIAGPSDHGKSSIVRALGLVLQNRPQGLAYIRNTEKDAKTKAVVTAIFDDCEISRVRSKSENYYTLNGQQLKAMGATVPEEVASAARMDDLNIQYQFSRKMQHYLLSMSSGEVARYLNSLLELDIIDATLKKVAGIASSADLEYKTNLKKAEEFDVDIERLGWITDALEDLKTAEGVEFQISEKTKRLKKIQAAYDDYKQLKDALDGKATKLRNLHECLGAAQNVADRIKSARKRADTLKGHIAAVQAAEKKRDASLESLTAAKAVYEALNKTIKRCPTCKRPL